MAYYPQINYLGAAQGMVGILENAERMKMAEQESLRRQEEAQSQAKFRDIQMKQVQDELDEKQRFRSSLSEYATRAQTDPDYKPSMAQRAIEDPETANEFYPGTVTQNYMKPAKKSQFDDMGQFLIEKGFPEKGLTLIAKQREEAVREKKDQIDFWQKGLMEFIKNGDNEGAKNWIDQGKKNPAIADQVGPLEGIRVNPKTKEMKIEVEMDVKDGQMKNPINGEPLPAGRYLIEQTVDPQGRQAITKAKPVESKEDDTDFKLFVKAKKSIGWDENRISTEWEKLKDKRSESSGLTAMAREAAADRAERAADRADRAEKQSLTDAGAKAELTVSKMLQDTELRIGGRPGNELKPEAKRAMDSILTAAGKPPLKRVIVPGGVEKSLFGAVKTKLPDKITYVPDEQAAPVPPPRSAPGAGLSGQLQGKPPVRASSPMPATQGQPGGGLSGVASKVPAQAPKQKELTKEGAKEFLRQAGGDRQKAEELARKQGFNF